MTKTFFARVDENNLFQMTVERELEDCSELGLPVHPALPETLSWKILSAPFSFGGAPSLTCVSKWVDGVGVWVETGTLNELRIAKVETMRLACTAAILAGFSSAALGAEFLYPAKPQDQANLVASVTDSLLAGSAADWTTPFWCADAGGEWDFRAHTIAQIQQVGRHGKAATLAAMTKNETLRQQIMTSTAEQLLTINW